LKGRTDRIFLVDIKRIYHGVIHDLFVGLKNQGLLAVMKRLSSIGWPDEAFIINHLLSIVYG
jgi:hypothetical protein